MRAMTARAREMWAAKIGIAAIMAHLRSEMGAGRPEAEQAIADMLRGK